MKKFQFRLDTVMNVYQLHEDRAQVTMQERVMTNNTAHQKLLECQDALQTSREKMNNEHQEVRCVAELLQHRLFISRLNRVVETQEKVFAQTKEEVELAREVLIEANRRTKMIENLKDKQYGQHCQSMLRQEQSTMDEIALRSNFWGNGDRNSGCK
jgi:flagellar export protein FliJ